MAEPIGEIPVQISGDFSQLEKDLQQAVKLAVESGKTLKEAIEMATRAPDPSGITNAFQAVGNAAQQSVGQLKLFEEAVSIPFADASGQINLFATELEQFGSSAKDAAAPLAVLGVETQKTAGFFEEFGGSIATWLTNPMESAKQAMGSFVTSLGPVGLVAAAAAAALGVLGKQIVDLVLEAGAAAEATDNLAARLNLSFQETKTLSEMAEVAGVNIGALNQASARLANALEDTAGAGKKTAEALGDIGIDVYKTIPSLVDVLEKLAQIPDANERISAANRIMGRSAIELEPLLKDYDALLQAVKALGGELSGETVESLKKADDASKLLTISWRHFKEGLAGTFSPAVTKGLEFLAHVLSRPENATLEKQIESLRKEIVGLEADANKASIAVTSMMGGGFTRMGGSPEVLAGMKAKLKALTDQDDAQKEAIKRSKEYNAILDELDGAARKWADGAEERAKQEKKAAAEREAAYRELIKAQKEAEDQTNKFHKALVNAGLRHPKFDQVEQDLESLAIQLNRGDISLEQFAKGMANLKAQLSTDIGEAMRVAARDAEILFESLNKLSAGELGQNFKGNAVAAELMAASLKQASDEAESASKGPLLSLDSALRILKITADEAGKATTIGLIALNAVLRDGDYDTVALVWAKMGSQIERLAKTNLPAAIAAWNDLQDSFKRNNAPLGEQLELQERITESIIKAKTQRGISANADIVALDQIRREQDKLIQSTQKWGLAYIEVGKELDRLLDAYKLIDKAINAAFDTSRNKQLSDSIKDLNRDLADHADAWEDAQRDASRAIEDINTDLERALAEELSDYNDFVRDIGEKYDEMVRDHREAQAEIVADANRSLRDQSIDYARFVEDANERLREAQAKGDEREIADIQKQLRRRAEDYTRHIADINAATAKRLADDRAAEVKQTEGIQEELAKRTEAHVKAQEELKAKAAEEVAAVEAKLAEQKAAYDQFVADTTAKILELEDQMTNAFERIGSAFKEMLLGFVSEVGKLLASTVLQGYLDQLKAKILGSLNIPIPGGSSSPVNLPAGAADIPGAGGIPGAKAPGGGTPSTGGGSGGALSKAGDVAGVVSAVSDVIANFQFYAMNKSLDIIVKHTLETVNELRNWRRDAWDQQTNLFFKLDDMWNEIRNVVDILRLIGGGGGLGGDESLAEQIAEVINSRPASADGSTQALLDSYNDVVESADNVSFGMQSLTPQIQNLDRAVSDAGTTFAGFVEDYSRAVAPLLDVERKAGFSGYDATPGSGNNAVSMITPASMYGFTGYDATPGSGGNAITGQMNTSGTVGFAPGNNAGSQQIGYVTVNAVDPSGRQIAKATITGLEERGIRVR